MDAAVAVLCMIILVVEAGEEGSPLMPRRPAPRRSPIYFLKFPLIFYLTTYHPSVSACIYAPIYESLCMYDIVTALIFIASPKNRAVRRWCIMLFQFFYLLSSA